MNPPTGPAKDCSLARVHAGCTRGLLFPPHLENGQDSLIDWVKSESIRLMIGCA